MRTFLLRRGFTPLRPRSTCRGRLPSAFLLVVRVIDMAALSAPAQHDANDSAWIVLKRLEACSKQGALAASIGLDPATLSTFFNGKGAIRAAQLRLLIEALGLKCVDKNSRCVRAETFTELTRLAGRALVEAPQLVWEDE